MILKNKQRKLERHCDPKNLEEIQYVLDLIAEGGNTRTIFKKLREKFGEHQTRSHYQFIFQRALKELEEIDLMYAEKTRRIQRERLEQILRLALEKKDYSTAVKTIEVMNKMFGIYETKQTIKLEDSTIKFEFDNKMDEYNETVNE